MPLADSWQSIPPSLARAASGTKGTLCERKAWEMSGVEVTWTCSRLIEEVKRLQTHQDWSGGLGPNKCSLASLSEMLVFRSKSGAGEKCGYYKMRYHCAFVAVSGSDIIAYKSYQALAFSLLICLSVSHLRRPFSQDSYCGQPSSDSARHGGPRQWFAAFRQALRETQLLRHETQPCYPVM
jgi:hypothetical protein